MHQVTIHEAKAHLSRLIKEALAGEEVIIAKGKQPVVRLVAVPEVRQQRRLGGAKGMVLSMADDFDAPLEDLEAYMK